MRRRNCPSTTSNGIAKSLGGDSTFHSAPTSLSKNCIICFSFSCGSSEQVTYTSLPPTLTRRDARCKICCCRGNRLARRSIPSSNPSSNVPKVRLASGFLLQDPTLQSRANIVISLRIRENEIHRYIHHKINLP